VRTGLETENFKMPLNSELICCILEGESQRPLDTIAGMYFHNKFVLNWIR